MEPYVYLVDAERTSRSTVLELKGPVRERAMMNDIMRKTGQKVESVSYDTFSMLPFSTINERAAEGSALYKARNEGEKILSMEIESVRELPVDEFFKTFEHRAVDLADEMTFDRTKEEYEEIIRQIIEDEVGKGEGSSFVTPRKCMGSLVDFNDATAKTIFRRLINNEYGTYWKFLFFDGTRYFIGASPERHLEVRHGKALMNPISGTFRKDHSKSREEAMTSLVSFLKDRKEINELFMVTDEELKMMSTMCGAGGKIVGPLLKEMAHLIHSEYLLEGEPNEGEDILALLRKSMFAPTVIGSPVGNACKVVAKYETASRSYYSSAAVLIGRDPADNGAEYLDSSITIRTLEVDTAGKFSIRVGATLVRDSVPAEEVKECEAKVRGMLTALRMDREFTTLRPEGSDEVQKTLVERNERTSRFWMRSQAPGVNASLKGLKVVMSNNEDDFIFMLRHIFVRMGCDVTVFNFFELEKMKAAIETCDLAVVGPGPGDPTDSGRTDGKMGFVRSFLQQLRTLGKPFLAVCLGHQVLSHSIGFDVVQKDIPTQGVQEVVDWYGTQEAVGFYNAFYVKHDAEKLKANSIAEVAVNGMDMLSMRGPHWTSFQFHPESILTVNGFEIVMNETLRLLRKA
ncbi:Anthranilate synthase [Diplonema papillatum]|nr:Anthranilate synthase [Diplonema papillatum]|eukprot:gene7774-11947_t